jgi:hypothetical protein
MTKSEMNKGISREDMVDNPIDDTYVLPTEKLKRATHRSFYAARDPSSYITQ